MNLKKIKIGQSKTIKAFAKNTTNEPIKFVSIRFKNGKVMKMKYLTNLDRRFFIFYL